MTDSTNKHTTPAGEVVVDGDHAALVFTRYLAHAPEVVWAALTEPQQFCAWFATTAQIDHHAGGFVDMVSGPSQMRWSGRILAWEPPRIFEYEWHIAPRPEIPQGESESIVRWELAPASGGTTLTLTHRRLAKPTALGFAPGTHAFLDRLAAYLDRAPLPNWTVRYGEVQHLYPSWGAPR
jgi:uncharacterized protein YndB with AHSA1/START domain